ncbi:FUSC family protein [Burkholderia sp. Ac-20365]|uniref:FUSC family protein n=1 Tax=Burkholderia sp. Ac-20365 TaxID=2703897 RepID=UPI00197BB436|nr:FUSC family protein [Burkholderia sp. Ac-20365]MBN3759352.1 FUSC family protein [Burkholderia sp. Ac-20365]
MEMTVSRAERAWLRSMRMHVSHWGATNGLIWLHLAKTLIAAFLAMGIAMKLEIPAPRTAMATVFVLMQPLSGMVLSKSFYRVLGTLAGAIAAVALGALFPQQASLYVVGMSLWVALCTAAAIRYRSFQWYAFVLAGYTAALIGIPTVLNPDGLFIAALNRGAEVLLGILCSGLVSAIVFPQWSGTRLKHMRRERFANFSTFAARSLTEDIDATAFRARYGEFVDSVVGFETTRAFASFEDPDIRARTKRLARLNSDFMDLCTRLHALHRFMSRVGMSDRARIVGIVTPFAQELAHLIAVHSDPAMVDDIYVGEKAASVATFRNMLSAQARAALNDTGELLNEEEQLDFDTAIELLEAFASGYVRYAQTYVSLAYQRHALEDTEVKYVVKTNRYVVLLTFVTTAVILGTIGAFWLSSDWPSGGYAIIGAAATAALSSNSPKPARFCMQMAGGAVAATAMGYLALAFLYPNITGFPLLCYVLAPLLGFGAFLATRPKLTGYGVSFCIFFCVLAGPDNVIHYMPQQLLNNGLALTISMLACALAFAVVFPVEIPWRLAALTRDLRGQVRLTCTALPDGLKEIFQSSTHDMMSQLRALAPQHPKGYDDALLWMLAVLEIGHAAIDLRTENRDAHFVTIIRPEWLALTDRTMGKLSRLFDDPTKANLTQCIAAIDAQIGVAGNMLDELYGATHKIQQVRRMRACLRFMRSTLIDKEAPFHFR